MKQRKDRVDYGKSREKNIYIDVKLYVLWLQYQRDKL